MNFNHPNHVPIGTKFKPPKQPKADPWGDVFGPPALAVFYTDRPRFAWLFFWRK